MPREQKVTREFWLSQKWGKLKLDPKQEFPESWGKGTKRIFIFLCECGRILKTSMNSVSTCRISCGRCTWKPKEFWLQQKWGKLVLDPSQELPIEWAPSTWKKFHYLCECGKKTTLASALVGGNTNSCGKCNEQSTSYWLAQKFGAVRLDPNQKLPSAITPSSNLFFHFLCDCGRTFTTRMDYIAAGVKSCGECSTRSKEHWLQQKWNMLHLDPDQELPKEWARYSAQKFRFICDCGLKRLIRVADVGGTLSCGCVKIGTSEHSPAYQIYKFVLTLAPDAQFSHWFCHEGKKWEYDIFIPSKNLAIEYHGLYWHVEERGGQRDFSKFQVSKKLGHRLIQIYSDEWEKKPEIIKAFLFDLLSSKPKIRIRPNYEILSKTSLEVRTFLRVNHYLGPASGCVTVAAKYCDKIVGAWVFLKRETGTVLWHRACWDHRYKTWNPHEKALSLALPELKRLGFSRLVTFSDNRFHTGELYEKLGFIFEKDIDPSYYYTDGYKSRKSKYSLRVPAGVNEKEEAANKGWHRIWDSGKKRYALNLNSFPAPL